MKAEFHQVASEEIVETLRIMRVKFQVLALASLQRLRGLLTLRATNKASVRELEKNFVEYF